MTNSKRLMKIKFNGDIKPAPFKTMTLVVEADIDEDGQTLINYHHKLETFMKEEWKTTEFEVVTDEPLNTPYDITVLNVIFY